MKLLITGSNGQLGNEFKVLAPLYPGFQFVFTDIEELDICDERALEAMIVSEKPEAIINCAAYTAVDKAEQEPEKAFRINATAPGKLAEAALHHNLILIHISTDYVFGGKTFRPYTEDDNKEPVSVYARSKDAGEEAVRGSKTKALIIRTSWLYSEFGNNFVKTILKYGRERGKLNVVFDQIGCPTYAYDLALVILTLLQSGNQAEGTTVYHYANEGVASWYDFAKAIVEFSGIDCTLHAIETRDYPLPAARPWYSVLNKAKIRETFGVEIPYWRDSLKTCLQKMGEII